MRTTIKAIISASRIKIETIRDQQTTRTREEINNTRIIKTMLIKKKVSRLIQISKMLHHRCIMFKSNPRLNNNKRKVTLVNSSNTLPSRSEPTMRVTLNRGSLAKISQLNSSRRCNIKRSRIRELFKSNKCFNQRLISQILSKLKHSQQLLRISLPSKSSDLMNLFQTEN